MKNRLAVAVMLMTALLLSSFQSFSQEKRQLGVKEALELSIKNSRQLKVNAAKIQEASAAVKEAEERRLPDVKASASALVLSNATVDIKTKQSSSGGSSGSSPKKVNEAAYGIVNATLPIYAGGRITYGIQSAKYLEEAIKLDAESDKDKIIINTLQAYDNLFKAKAAVDIVKQSLENAKHRVEQFANLEKNGLMARNDYLKAQLQASNTELSLLEAENNWKLANINMDLLLGLPESTELAPDSNWQMTNELKPVDIYLQSALQYRKDLQALNYRKKAAATGVKATEAEKYPFLALTGGYVALNVPNALVIYNAMNLGIGVQYSLSSLWKNKSKVDQAKAREDQIIATQDILADAIRLQVYQSYQNFLTQKKKIDVYKVALEQAEENYKIVNNKYKNGLALVADLLDADVAQLQAQLNYSNARSDASVGYQQLLETAGVLTIE